MRWLLQWLVEDVCRLFGIPVTAQADRRAEMVRQRARKRYHSRELSDAEERLRTRRRTVRVLEVAADTPREDLVEARRAMMLAEGDVRHHRARLHQAREALAELREAAGMDVDEDGGARADPPGPGAAAREGAPEDGAER